MKGFFKSNWLVVAILVAHFALGVLYSVAVPIYESYDEWGHYPYVRYIATHWALPKTRLVEWNDETHQPPLYYILGALATFWIDTSDEFKPIQNPFSLHCGNTGGGVNLFLHLEESFPYRGTVLAIHVARLVSVLLSTVTVWATYFIGRTLFPNRKEIALGAMAVNAFWPQFIFHGSVVTNDIIVTTCASLVLLFLMRIVIHRRWALDSFGLGLCLGGGLMSKRNALALVPLALIGLAIVAIREVRRKNFALLGWVVCFLGSAGLISVWWSRRLLETYRGHVLFIVSLLSHPSQIGKLHWHRLPDALYFCFVTFCAAFGWQLVGVEVWIYKLLALVCLVACLGLTIFLTAKKSNRLTKLSVVILVVHLLLVLSAPAYLTLRGAGKSPAGPTIVGPVARGGAPLVLGDHVFAFQGRYVLPAISAFSLLLFLGLASLVPQRFVKMCSFCMGLAMFGWAVLVPFRYILPVYAKPAMLSPSEVQDLECPLDLKFDDKIELLGYELDHKEVGPGDGVSVTLYWRCLSEMEENYPLAVKVLGQDYRVYGVLHLHPGRGNFPTSIWKEGDIFRETYQVPISPDAPSPSLAQIGVDFFLCGSPGKGLDAFDSEGRPSNATFGRLIIRSKEQPKIETTMRYELGGKVALVGYEMDREESGVRVKLYWLALTEMDKDYTVFVHLLDEEDRIKAQDDSQPMGGNSPTSIWKAGEVIEDEHSMPLPPGEGEGKHRVVVGMYELATMERLAVFDADGSRLPQDAIVLEKIELPLAPKNIDEFRCFSLDDIQPTPDERLRAHRAGVIPWLVDEGIWSLEDALGAISFWIW